MRPEDVPRLPDELADLAAQEAAQREIRRRLQQERRRRRTRRLVAALTALVLVGGVGVGVYLVLGALETDDDSATTAAGGASPDRARPAIAAVDLDGRLVGLDASGEQVSVLLEPPANAVTIRAAREGGRLGTWLAPTTVSAHPDGSSVYVGYRFRQSEPPCPPDARYQPPAGRIRRVPLDGGEPEDVAKGLGPAVSPDGATLAFISNGTCEELPQLVLRSLVDDSPDVVLGDPQSLPVNQPAWAPDGTRMLVSMFRASDCVDCVRGEVRLLDLSGTPSLVGAPVVGGQTPGCRQWSMVFLGDDVVSVLDESCGVETEQLSLTDPETGATREVVIGESASSFVAGLRAAGDRLLIIGVEGESGTTSLASWSEDEGYRVLEAGISAAAWIPGAGGSS